MLSMNDFCYKHFNEEWSTRVVPKVYFKTAEDGYGITRDTIYYLGPSGYVYTVDGTNTGIGVDTTKPYFILGTQLQQIYLGGE